MAITAGTLIQASHVPSYRTMYDDAVAWNQNYCATNCINRTNNSSEYSHNNGVKTHNNSLCSGQWSGLCSNNSGQKATHNGQENATQNGSNWSWNWTVYNSQYGTHWRSYNADARSYA